MHIKKYLFRKYNNKCARCGWGETNVYTERIPLEVEHIDGNYKNNKEENLILLCPNCHSLTSTYKGANLNNGRKTRKNTTNIRRKNMKTVIVTGGSRGIGNALQKIWQKKDIM